METLDQIEMENNQPGVSPLAAQNMRATAPWMIFVGVMFLLSGAMMVLTGIAIFFGSDQYKSIDMENMFLLMGAFYLIGGLMFVGCGILLISGGSKLSTFSKFPSHLGLESFTAKQKIFWVVMGAFWIVSIIMVIGVIAMAGRMASLVGNSL